MQGSIRFGVGLLVAFSMVEATPETPVYLMLLGALCGVTLMLSGARALARAA